MSGALDALSRRIDTTRSLESIVRTMKALSTASIAQYDRAAITMSRYMRTVELGMTAVLRQDALASASFDAPAGAGHRYGHHDSHFGGWLADVGPAASTTMVILFGSDHGFCGNFNERVVSFAVDGRTQDREGRESQADAPCGANQSGAGQSGADQPVADQLVADHSVADHPESARGQRTDSGPPPDGNWRWLCVGTRAAQALNARGHTASSRIHLPGTADGLTETCQQILLIIDDWRRRHRVDRILVFHNRRRAETVEPHRVALAPHERAWLREITRRPWPSRTLPMYTLPAPRLYAALVREHLFASLFRSGAESLASEHAARLAAMHAALNNIEEHLETMNAEYQRQRQESITAELLDIVAGYEILRKREPAS